MNKSVQYTQVMSNFDSVYNTSPTLVHRPTIYMPIPSSSSSFPSNQNRSNLKFNLDLYNPNEYHSESIDYPSPTSSVIIHHRPVYSPPPSQAISKLRQINDELCHTLAQCDINPQSQPSPSPSPSPSHHHIHHYPIPHETYRSRSPSEQDSSSTESEPITKKRNARITYKARIPRRQNSLSKVDQLLISTSDAYSHDDPMTIDLYPTRDQGFVKNIRNRLDNQSPWLTDTSPIRRNSYSETSTYRTPRAPYYDNKPIQPKSRLANGKDLSPERPRSLSVKSRFRPDSAPNPLRQSAIPFSSTVPVWRPNGSIKRPKFIGSQASPSKPKPRPSEPRWNPAGVANKRKPFRAFDPVSESLPKPHESVWHSGAKSLSEKPPKYFKPTLKPELIAPIQKQTAPVFQKRPTTIHNADPKLKTRVVKAESKVKSAWEGTTTDKERRPPVVLKRPTTIHSGDPKLKNRVVKAESKVKSAWEGTTTDKEPKPPVVPHPIKKPTTKTLPPKAKVKPVASQPTVPVNKKVPAPPVITDTGRSSLNDVPTKPLFQSTPRNLSIDVDPDDLFENESQISEPTKKTEIPHPPPQIEKTPTKLPNTTATEPDKGTKSTIKDGVLIHGDDADNQTPSLMSEANKNADEEKEESLKPSPIPHKQKAPLPEPDDASVVHDEDIHEPNENDTDGDVEPNFAHDDTAKDIDNIVSPSTPKADTKISHRRKEPSPPPESPEPNSNKSPVNSKKNDRKLPSTPPPAAATTNKDVDDFFD